MVSSVGSIWPMKSNYFQMKTIQNCFFAFCLFGLGLFTSCNGNAQSEIEKALVGTWELQGNLMGDDGEGFLLSHKPANPECEADHSVFAEDYTAKEVRYNASCQANENAFSWKLDDNLLTLTKGEQRISWLIHSIEGGKMTVGVPVRPDSEKRMYVVYKKQN